MIRRAENGNLFWDNGVFLGECLQDVDGYYKWWPNQQTSGYLDEGFLLEMYNFLHELNREWDAQVRRELGGPDAPTPR